MKNECSIVRDLLPLYAEDMLSPETSEFVAEHLKGCDGCRKEFERTKEPKPTHCDVSDAAPLKLIRKRLYLKRIGTAACAVVLALALFVSAFAVLDAPEYLPYSQGLVKVEELDGGLKLSFGKGVTDFDYRTYADPDDPDHLLCSVEAWTSTWDRWLGKSAKTTVISTENAESVTVYYTPNNGSDDVLLYGDANGNEGSVTLPRLTPGYLLLLALCTEALLWLLFLVFRKNAAVKSALSYLLPYPVLYVAAQLLVVGISFASYSMPRDFFLSLFISLLLYCGLLIFLGLRRLRSAANP